MMMLWWDLHWDNAYKSMSDMPTPCTPLLMRDKAWIAPRAWYKSPPQCQCIVMYMLCTKEMWLPPRAPPGWSTRSAGCSARPSPGRWRGGRTVKWLLEEIQYTPHYRQWSSSCSTIFHRTVWFCKTTEDNLPIFFQTDSILEEIPHRPYYHQWSSSCCTIFNRPAWFCKTA